MKRIYILIVFIFSLISFESLCGKTIKWGPEIKYVGDVTSKPHSFKVGRLEIGDDLTIIGEFNIDKDKRCIQIKNAITMGSSIDFRGVIYCEIIEKPEKVFDISIAFLENGYFSFSRNNVSIPQKSLGCVYELSSINLSQRLIIENFLSNIDLPVVVTGNSYNLKLITKKDKPLSNSVPSHSIIKGYLSFSKNSFLLSSISNNDENITFYQDSVIVKSKKNYIRINSKNEIDLINCKIFGTQVSLYNVYKKEVVQVKNLSYKGGLYSGSAIIKRDDSDHPSRQNDLKYYNLLCDPEKWLNSLIIDPIRGTYTKNGTKYDGEWKDGLYDGQGILTQADGTKYDGTWKRGMRNGIFKTTYANGKSERREWKDDKKVIPQGSFERLIKQYDEFEFKYYYYNSIFTHSNTSNKFSVFLVEKDNRYRFYCKVSISNSDDSMYWSDKAVLLCDGQTVEMRPEKSGDAESESLFSYTSYSWFEYPMTTDLRVFLSKISNNSVVKLRVYANDKIKDRQLSSEEVEAIVEVMNVIKSNFSF